MSEIKLTAKRKNTDDWLLFCLSDLFHSAETGLYQVCVEDVGLFAIDPSTIQPADDPRRQMLDAIRAELRGLILVQAKGLPVGYPCEWVDKILDEQEAKL